MKESRRWYFSAKGGLVVKWPIRTISESLKHREITSTRFAQKWMRVVCCGSQPERAEASEQQQVLKLVESANHNADHGWCSIQFIRCGTETHERVLILC